MKVGEVMTPGVATVHPDTSLSDAARTMIQFSISGLPVIDAAGKLAGIVMEGGLLRRADCANDRKCVESDACIVVASHGRAAL